MSKFMHLTDNDVEVPIMGPMTVSDLVRLTESLPDATKLMIRKGRITVGCKFETQMSNYENVKSDVLLVAGERFDTDLFEIRDVFGRNMTSKIKIRWIGRVHNIYQIREHSMPTSINSRQIVFEVLDP